MRFVKISVFICAVLTMNSCAIFKGKKDCDCPHWGSHQQPNKELILADSHKNE